jgi:hypothetical protein
MVKINQIPEAPSPNQVAIYRLRDERKRALKSITIFAARLREAATSEEQVGDGAGTPGNLVRLATELECARVRAVSARLALDVLGADPE